MERLVCFVLWVACDCLVLLVVCLGGGFAYCAVVWVFDLVAWVLVLL